MKKFFVFMMAACAALAANAQCAYVLINAATIDDINGEQAVVEGFEASDEDPEINAARFFRDNYVDVNKGMFIQPSDIATLNPTQVPVLWINCDRVGMEQAEFDGIFNETVINAIKAYSAAGGKLYLTKQASRINFLIGRILYAPGFSNGGYHMGGDIWSMNTRMGSAVEGCDNKYDYASHPFFAGMEADTTKAMSGWDWDNYHHCYGLVGPNLRTDNNCLWVDYFRKAPEGWTGEWAYNGDDAAREGVPTDYCKYSNGEERRYTDFMQDWNCTPLCCWGQVLDFCAPLIIDWNPQTGFSRIVTNGAAAYQWGASNTHVEFIEMLTANILNELGANQVLTAVENTQATVKAQKMMKNGMIVIVKDGVEYNALGVKL